MNTPTDSGHAPDLPIHLSVDTARYLDLGPKAERILDRLDITVSPRSFMPEVDDLRKDWVASIAVPAFKLIRQSQGIQEAFCSVGTGVGLDALAAIEILGASQVGITDVHEDVVGTAASNISSNLRSSHPIRLEAGHGDLFAPLREFSPRYDLVYENLPNVPVKDASLLAHARVSSSHLSSRSESIPARVQSQLLSLHYLVLQQAHDFLKPGGAVLSMLGSRIPLAVYLEMAQLAGHRAEIYLYGWKVQADAESVIKGHAEQQRAGYGPFHFYLADQLASVFDSKDLITSGKQASDIEARLASSKLDPFQALEALQRGKAIGHTVAVLRSQPCAS